VGFIVGALAWSAFSVAGAVFATWVIVGFVVARVLYNLNYKEAKKYNDAVYRPKKAIWDRSIMCMRCGTIAEEADTAV
jgi:hypothetical protein